MTVLQAGIGRKTISPPRGVYLIGYGARLWGNRGIHDDLTATALAFDDGNTRAIIVACDLLAINEHTVARVQAASGENNLQICCSHTHSAPVVYAYRHSTCKNRHYVDFLVTQLAAAIRAAVANLQPATLAWAEGEADIAVNRRERKPDGSIVTGVNPTGSVDRALSILQVKAKTGELLATMVNFACHNTVFRPDNRLASADWAGAMRRHVEAKTAAPCLYIQGATADLNPERSRGLDDAEAVQVLGKRVADQVLASLQGMREISAAAIHFQATQIWLPLETKATTPQPPSTYKQKLAKLFSVPPFLVDLILNTRYPWKTTIESRNGVWAIPMQTTALRIGEFALYGLGMEVFHEIGLKIKATTPTTHTMIGGVCNGCVGYLPTTEEHARGGYEIDIVPYFYRLPGRFSAEVESITLTAIQKQGKLLNS